MSGDGDSSDFFDEVSSALSQSFIQRKLTPGDVVGDYEVVRQLGEGGFGVVYEGLHCVIERRCAIKVLRGTFLDRKKAAARFIDEARAVHRIDHRNVVDIFDMGELPDGSLYLVMELLEGEDLAQHLADAGALEPAFICEVLGPISGALEAAHRKGIVHRDLKPENIFLTHFKEGRLVPKLLDFGVAKLLGDSKEGARHHTATGVPIGTPQYMSPEQCLALAVDHRSDVYALGVLFYECLTGSVPFDGGAYVVIANQHTQAERPKVSAVRPELGIEFDAPIQTMMAVDAADRPNTATDAFRLFADACDAWSGEGETAKRIAKTVQELPTYEELLGAQTTQPWIKTDDLPNRPESAPTPTPWILYAAYFTVALFIGALVAWLAR